MRESWTDERLDDFRGEVNRRFDKFEGDVDRRFDKVDHELHRINDRLDGLHRLMIQFGGVMAGGMFVMFAALIGLVATQL